MAFNQGPLDVLKRTFPTAPNQGPVGKSVQNFLDIIRRPNNFGRLFFDRVQVRKICTDPNVNVLDAYAVAMAWGNQDKEDFRASIRSGNLKSFLSGLRRFPQVERAKDYEDAWNAFCKKSINRINGVGIAYFTKCLYFFRSDPDAYILDQWTAKGIRLLTSPCPIKLTARGTDGYRGPSVDTSGRQYEEFCSTVEDLARKLWPELTGNTAEKGSHAEVALFGKGSDWRKFVSAHFLSVEIDAVIERGGNCITAPEDWDLGLLVLQERLQLFFHFIHPINSGPLALPYPADIDQLLKKILHRVEYWNQIYEFPSVLFLEGLPDTLPDWFKDRCLDLGVSLRRATAETTCTERQNQKLTRTNWLDGSSIGLEEPEPPEGFTPTIPIRLSFDPSTYIRILPIGGDPNWGYISKTQSSITVYDYLRDKLPIDVTQMPGFRTSYSPHGAPGKRIVGTFPRGSVEDAKNWLRKYFILHE